MGGAHFKHTTQMAHSGWAYYDPFALGQLPVYPVRNNVGQTMKLSRVAERGIHGPTPFYEMGRLIVGNTKSLLRKISDRLFGRSNILETKTEYMRSTVVNRKNNAVDLKSLANPP